MNHKPCIASIQLVGGETPETLADGVAVLREHARNHLPAGSRIAIDIRRGGDLPLLALTMVPEVVVYMGEA